MADQYRIVLAGDLHPWLRNRLRQELLDHFQHIQDIESARDVLRQLMADATEEQSCDYELQLAELDYLTTSEAAAKSLAEQYVGLPMD